MLVQVFNDTPRLSHYFGLNFAQGVSQRVHVPLQVRAGWIRTLYPTVRIIEAWDGPDGYGEDNWIPADDILRSPEDTTCILLDTLKAANIKEIFEKWLVRNDEFISKLCDITSGVPRFVAHAVDFFTNRIAFATPDRIDYQKRRADFMQDSGSFVKYLESVAPKELNPFQSMQIDKKKFYVELIRAAALCLPLRLDNTIDGEIWGFGTDVMTLEVCSAFPLYLRRCDENYHFLVIPPVILNQIADEKPDSRLPFWISVYHLH